MLLSEVERNIRNFSNKGLMTVIAVGAIWSAFFNVFFVNTGMEKSILIEIQRYGLIILSVLFFFAHIFFIQKVYGFFNYFLQKINYRNKLKYFFVSVTAIVMIVVALYLFLSYLDEFYNIEKEVFSNRRERMGKIMFSFDFLGVWFLSFSVFLFVFCLVDALIFFIATTRYLFDGSYRRRYERELSNIIIKENKNV
ncbi:MULTISPECIES: hypothetical protein [Gallibacterium]|uniref:Uncharacterized protein n=2 Tax=Gallibacterium TaxID=155493 RepID=A0A1A7PZE8_9PAST|nr:MULTISPECIES: hypothetical protein [Gallibacterium]OBW94254.1 hypothetical protein QV02_08250 [Gallibacterium anatis]OBW98246.1 hypothetical protein QV03_07615 [Gallibacterium anatis]OBX07389.1 hypothetical protein QV07_07160 [Gallibacterium genomosp. 3]